MRFPAFLALCATLLCGISPAIPSPAVSGEAQADKEAENVDDTFAPDALWRVLDRGLELQRAAISNCQGAADSAAVRFLAGGRLWVGGSFPDFSGEACNRAGGLMPLAALGQIRAAEDRPRSGDVALLGFHTPQEDEVMVVRKFHDLGLLVVGFGARAAHPAAACDFWFEAGGPQQLAGAPVASVLSIANLWAFTGEFITACLRRGQMPTVWQSIMMPGSRERNARYRPLRVHPDMLPPPQAAGWAASANTDSLQACLRRFRDTEWARLEAGAALLRGAGVRGRTAYVCPLGGHLRSNRLDLADTLPDLKDLSRYVKPAELAGLLHRGDALYIQGYVDPPLALLEAAHAAGAATVISLAGRNGQPPDCRVADVVLDAHWEVGDASVPLPGYDVALLPPSGFMAASIYWALVLAMEDERR